MAARLTAIFIFSSILSYICSGQCHCTPEATISHDDFDLSRTLEESLHDLINNHFQQSRLHAYVEHFADFLRSGKIRNE